ncbi:MAG: hypothetical protein ACYDAD_02190 [Acidimicrobiales bacterium]
MGEAGRRPEPEPGPDLDRIDAWAAEARARHAANARSRERWLRQEAEEEATFASALADLAERRESVTIVLVHGRSRTGRILGVGQDFLVLRVGETHGPARTVLCALGAVGLLRRDASGEHHPSRWAPAPAGERARPPRPRLVSVLSEAVAERCDIEVGVIGGEVVSGELRAVGTDVLTVLATSPEAPTGAIALIRLESICDVALPAALDIGGWR